MSTFFDHDRSRRILGMWDAGKNLMEIGTEFGIPETRAAHEINKLLNERNGFFAKARYDE